MSALTDLFTNIANAIRSKKGTSETIVASDFPTEIENIPTGGDISDYISTSFSNFQYSPYTTNAGGWTKNVKELLVDTISGSIIYNLFSCFAGTKISFNPNIDTSSVTDMCRLFAQCGELTTIENLNALDTNNVTNMEGMFWGCAKLQSLDLSTFDVSSCTSTRQMFYNAKRLNHLDIRSFDFSTITNTSDMFGTSGTRIPSNCEIIVKDSAAKTYLNTNFNWLTNVKTVEEYEQSA